MSNKSTAFQSNNTAVPVHATSRRQETRPEVRPETRPETRPDESPAVPAQVNIRGGRRAARFIAKAGILAAVAILLMYLEFTVPLMPTFLKMDFSEIAVMLAAFSLGPIPAILIEAVKNLVHLPGSMTGGIGELANFVIGSLFVGTAGFVYRRHKTRRTAYLGMLAGTLVMTLGASLINYYIMIPIYIKVVNFPLVAIIAASNAVGNTLVTSLETLILYVFVPFNIFKGIVTSLIVAVIYKRVSPLLHR